MKREKLLLHVCCGPCSTSVVEKLMPQYDITLFYYNPNTMPFEEFDRRLNELKKYNSLSGNNLKIIVPEYENELFLQFAKNLQHQKEGEERCQLCFNLRLTKTANYAKSNVYDCFATTLSVSPYKNLNQINKIGNNLSQNLGIRFLDFDFKLDGGYKRSIELSKKYNLYRQNYCGCKFYLGEKL